jgi:uncharacterized membrane protein YdbT with pleckstrin-like domain
MSYVRSVLQPGEEVRYQASVHWITYYRGVLLLLAAGIVWAVVPTSWHDSVLVQIVVILLAAGGVIELARAWFDWWITEIAVTNRRVIQKRGFIWRKTAEMNMDKVESVEVDQSILGRLLDYGDVTITGTGAGLETLKMIATPIELRNHITGV